jgi:hypothetical protein
MTSIRPSRAEIADARASFDDQSLQFRIAARFATAMNPDRMLNAYSWRAEGTDNPVLRTVYLLGLTCALALKYGTFVGPRADWPDPRDRSLNDRGMSPQHKADQ